MVALWPERRSDPACGVTESQEPLSVLAETTKFSDEPPLVVTSSYPRWVLPPALATRARPPGWMPGTGGAEACWTTSRVSTTCGELVAPEAETVTSAS